MSSDSRRKALLPLLVLVGGIAGAALLILTPPQAERTEPVSRATPVSVLEARRETHRVIVTARGTVIPDREIALQSEIAGRIVEVGNNLIPGGQVAEGELLVRIDPRDYRLVTAQREADVARARFELEVEEGRGRVAEREWKLLGSDTESSSASRRLALRKPQRQNLRAALEAAKSGLEKARLDLARTEIRAPFNALVQEESVDVGQTVTPQTRLARLIGSERFRVRVSLPVGDLQWVELPNGDAPGSAAVVFQETGDGKPIRRRGRVARLLGNLEPTGRLARVLVIVDNPLRLSESGARLPLFIGAYVRVEIQGPHIERVVAIPRKALREDRTVWVMTDEDELALRPVYITWRGEDTVYVSEGLADGDRVILSSISAALPGLHEGSVSG